MPDRPLEVMETVQDRLIAPGTRFLNAYTAIPLCGPNRAAILSGRFPHTTKVTTNSAWQAFSGGGHEAFTFVKALHDAGGYETALFGKYMNGRGSSTSIPPGWDRWFELPGSSQHSSTGYVVNDQGKNVSYPNTKKDSELAYEKALAWIKAPERTPASRPFFIQYSPTNPHLPFTPTAAHAHDYDNEPARDAPSVNEVDMRDKSAKIRKIMGSVAMMKNAEEGMREELEDTDDLIAGLLDAAEAVTGNSNLLIIFHSDNGIQVGEHRLIQKSWPYQESIEAPLIMRGTGLPAQQEPTQLVSSVDIFGTILRFAGVAPPRALDGRSLDQIVLGIQPASWRKRILIEDQNDRNWEMYREFQPAAGKDFAFIRRLNDPTPEYYNLRVDQYQLSSKPAMVTSAMRSKLDRLTSLTGANLRAVEA
jgi:N-acetylglucosamine-6-sulfatase